MDRPAADGFDRSVLVTLLRYGANASRMYDMFSADRMAKYPFDPIHPATNQWPTYRTMLGSLAAIAKQENATLIIISQAHCMERSRHLMNGSDALAIRVAEMNRIQKDVVRQWEETGNVRFVDAASHVTATTNTMLDRCHFTRDGYRALGHYVASEIIQNVLRLAQPVSVQTPRR